MGTAMWAKVAGVWQQVFPDVEMTAPSLSAVTPGGGVINLMWTSAAINSGTVASYDVSVNGTVTNLGNVLSHSLTGLTDTTQYTIKVRGVSALGLQGPWSTERVLYPAIPLNIAGIGLWLDASDTATIVHAANAVSEWNDKSGAGRHFVQTVAGNKPVTNVAVQNSKNGIRFDGNDFLENAAQAGALFSPSMTWFWVAKSDSGDDDYIVYAKSGPAARSSGTTWNGNGGSGGLELHSHMDSSDRSSAAYTDGGTNTLTSAYRNGTINPRIGGIRFKPSSKVQIIAAGNAAEANSSANNSNTLATPGYPITWWALGAHGSTDSEMQRLLKGDLFEVVLFRAYLSDADITTMYDYLAAKWSVT